MGREDVKLKLIVIALVLVLLSVAAVIYKLTGEVKDIKSTGDEYTDAGDSFEDNESKEDWLADQVARGLSGMLDRSDFLELREYIVDTDIIDLIYLNYGKVGVEDNGDIDVTSIYEQTIEQFNETDEMDDRLYEKDGRWYMPRDIVESSEEDDILVWYKGQGIFISKGDISGERPDRQEIYSFDEKFDIGGESKYYYTGSDGSRVTIWIEYLGDSKYGLELEGVVFERSDEYKILE